MSTGHAHAAGCFPTINMAHGKGKLHRPLGCGVDKLLTPLTRNCMQRLCLSFPLAFTPQLAAVPVSLSCPLSPQGLYPCSRGLQVLSPATLKCFFLSSHARTHGHIIAPTCPFWIYGAFIYFHCFSEYWVLGCSDGYSALSDPRAGSQECFYWQSHRLHHTAGAASRKTSRNSPEQIQNPPLKSSLAASECWIGI